MQQGNKGWRNPTRFRIKSCQINCACILRVKLRNKLRHKIISLTACYQFLMRYAAIIISIPLSKILLFLRSITHIWIYRINILNIAKRNIIFTRHIKLRQNVGS